MSDLLVKGPWIATGEVRGLQLSPGGDYERGANGRERWVEYGWTVEENWYRHLRREGTRSRFRPKLLLQTCQVKEGPRINDFTFTYVDRKTFDEGAASKVPRGLVHVAESEAQAQMMVIVKAAGNAMAVTIKYRQAERTYRYYSGLPADQTRASGAPPFMPKSEVLEVILPTDLEIWLKVRDISKGLGLFLTAVKQTARDSARFDWVLGNKDSNENGGHWMVDETYRTRLSQEIVPLKGWGGVGGW